MNASKFLPANILKQHECSKSWLLKTNHVSVDNWLNLYQLALSSWWMYLQFVYRCVFACCCSRLFSWILAASSLTTVSMWDGPWAGLWWTGWRGGGAVVPVVVVPGCKPFALLLLHKELHHEDLLLVHLETDVLGNVWDQPVHKVTHKHHHILHMT